jgi:hypothetical protein
MWFTGEIDGTMKCQNMAYSPQALKSEFWVLFSQNVLKRPVGSKVKVHEFHMIPL